MLLLLDTSTPECRLMLVADDDVRTEYTWEAGRTLAKGLLEFLETSLIKHDKSLKDVTGIGVLRGPGSFTGLRIGLTVCNTAADALSVPIVGAEGDAWQEAAIGRLRAGESDVIVLPEYGGEAHITKPRK